MVALWPATVRHRCQFVIAAMITTLALAHVYSNWRTARSSNSDSSAITTIADAKSESASPKCKDNIRKLPRIQYVFPDAMPVKWTEKMEQRRADIKQSFLHAWHGYKKYAMGQDELRPVSNTYINKFGGWGATLIDSLTTLHIMGLDAEFNEALSHLPRDFHTKEERLSVFETTIRHLAGLISAYELSGHRHKALLRKAEALGQALLPAFDNAAGYPSHFWDQSRSLPFDDKTLFAEVGTVQLEFFMLSHHTGDTRYATKAQTITEALDRMGYEHGLNIPGLYPTHMSTAAGGRFLDSTCTLGAMGDSAYEYFLKQYILTEGMIPQYAKMYIESIDNVKRHMLYQLPNTPLLFLPPLDTETMQPGEEMDHLACFAPGMLAIGAQLLDRPDDLVVAEGLLETCVYMYRSSSTGLGPETWRVPYNVEPYNRITYAKDRSKSREWWNDSNATVPVGTSRNMYRRPVTPYQLEGPLPDIRGKPRYLGLDPVDRSYMLRPETLESIFILYRITGDPKYREYGWEIYQSIEKWCKTPSGYAAIRDVELDAYANGTTATNNWIDKMESFLLAETFKYLYLLFSPPDVISLDEYVFNTEAHPFARRSIDWVRLIFPGQSKEE